MGVEAAYYIGTALLAVKSASDSREDARDQSRRAEERMKKDQLKILGEREGAKADAENAKRRKQLEELGRKGRRASILTSPSGAADQLGSVARPGAQALTETLG